MGTALRVWIFCSVICITLVGCGNKESAPPADTATRDRAVGAAEAKVASQREEIDRLRAELAASKTELDNCRRQSDGRQTQSWTAIFVAVLLFLAGIVIGSRARKSATKPSDRGS
jgi:hypothetical protein